MVIRLVNQSSIRTVDVQKAVKAINLQLTRDFGRYWAHSATVVLGGVPDAVKGDGVLYLSDTVNDEGILGYHGSVYSNAMPYGVVYTKLSEQLGEKWTVTLSHEVLELALNAHVNLYVIGPHPTEDRTVFFWREACDAVQAEEYAINGVYVSNFVTPLYFTTNEEAGQRNDFLNRRYKGESLYSLWINPGGYVGYWDPVKDMDEIFYRKGDDKAKQKAALKLQQVGARSYRCAKSKKRALRAITE